MENHKSKSGNPRDYNQSDYNGMDINEFTKTFKDSLDVLNSIKQISKMREKSGLVNHSYNVKNHFSRKFNTAYFSLPIPS